MSLIHKMDEVITPSGSLELSSNIEFQIGQTIGRDFGWRVEGFLEKEISFSWGTGEGEYYWYRVEGECQKIECENSGVDAGQCNKMTFVTVVSARNASEVCEILNSPRLNPPVNLRVAAIRRYARPVLKGSVPDDLCNTLDDQEFCHIPECLDYCVDEDIFVPSQMFMEATEFINFREMSGGFLISGSSETNRNRRYSPESPKIVLFGSSSPGVVFFATSSGSVEVAGESTKTFSKVVLSFSGSLHVIGSSRVSAPGASFSFSGGITVGQNSSVAFPRYPAKVGQNKLATSSGFEIFTENGELLLADSNLIFTVSGSSLSFVSMTATSTANIDFSGSATDYISPSYFYRPEGAITAFGEADRNFESLGTISVDSFMEMSHSDFSSDFNDLSGGGNLTISDFLVESPCGCGALGLSLNLKHNLFGSSYLSSFLRKNNLALPQTVSMRHKLSDASWASMTHFSGSGSENWSLLFSLSCETSSWRFVFSAKKSTPASSLHTKLIIDMPSDFVCSDNRISTRISLGVGVPASSFSGSAIGVVSPIKMPIATLAQNAVKIDESFFDYVVYYDNIGIFKDSYWLKTPFEVYIDPSRTEEMPLMNLQSIF